MKNFDREPLTNFEKKYNRTEGIVDDYSVDKIDVDSFLLNNFFEFLVKTTESSDSKMDLNMQLSLLKVRIR